MEESIIGFIGNNIGIRAIIDIVIVASLIYVTLIFFKQTRSFFILSTIIILSGISYLSGILNLELTRELFQPFLTFFILILVIVFQREIRRFFEWFSLSGRNLAIQGKISLSQEISREISQAVSTMVNEKIGALIVLSGDHPVERSLERAIEIDGRVSIQLLLSIFDPSSPGHDGAVIISDNRIKYFGAHLPLSQNGNEQLNKFGTRHRAAVGITEENDALVIVVSEEKGVVSIAKNGILKEVSREKFQNMVENFVRTQSKRGTDKNPWRYLIIHNWIEKISSILLAIILWIVLIT